MATLKYLSQYFSTTLNVGGGIDDSQTTGIILQSVSGVHDITEPGQICITYSDPVDTAVAEWIDYTSINGSNELVGAVRGREGFSAHAHLQGATVAFVLSASHHNDIVDQLNGTETGTTLKAPVITGQISGEALTGGYPITNSSMSRQAIINGNFDVWQRGTTFTPVDSSNIYSADRWNDYHTKDGGTLPTLSRSRQLLTSGDIANTFYYSRFTMNGAGTSLGASSVGLYGQRIENGTRFLCGLNKKVTVSFWARSDVANKRMCPVFTQAYGSGGSPSTAEVIKGTVITLTSTWTKYTQTVTTNTLVGKTFGTDNMDYLALEFWFVWGTTSGNTYVQTGVTAETYVGSGYLDIAQVQLCAGDVALPFQPKSEAQEKLDCWRYAFKAGSDTSGYSSIASGNCTATTSASALIVFPVRMRTAPTSTYPTANTLGVIAAAGTVVALTVIADDVLTDYSARVTCTTASGLTAGNATNLIKNNSTSTILFSAEL